MSFMLSVANKPIMPSVVMLSVITLSVVAPHAMHEATSRVHNSAKVLSLKFNFCFHALCVAFYKLFVATAVSYNGNLFMILTKRVQ
jgi:hypothetical protein